MSTAIVIGSTGLIGKQLLGQLLESPNYSHVIALVRTPLLWKHEKLQEVLFDFDHPDAAFVKGDEVFCCLGTTLAKAGSEAAQKQIDYAYPLRIAELAKQNGVQQYILVSSLGAKTEASNFYLRTKGELEQAIENLQFRTFISVQPSILLGKRDEFRFGEQIGIGLAKVVGPMLSGKWKKYRAIKAEQVAKAMIALAQKQEKGTFMIESDKLAEIA